MPSDLVQHCLLMSYKMNVRLISVERSNDSTGPQLGHANSVTTYHQAGIFHYLIMYD